MLRSGMKSSAHCAGEPRVGKRGKVDVLGDISRVATAIDCLPVPRRVVVVLRLDAAQGA